VFTISAARRGLKALDLAAGKRTGRTGQFDPCVVFTGGWDGILRAVDSTGNVIWTFDANKDFQTVNGVIANGGSFGCAGPVVAGGMVYVASGYPGIMGGSQGNIVFAFGPE
jgi:polyvinyl alcohol dehydrogenase (cytochrome)